MRVNFLFDNWATGKALVTGMDLVKPFPTCTREELLGILYRGQVSDEALMAVAFNLLQLQSPELEMVNGGCYALAVDIEESKFGVTVAAKMDETTFVDLCHNATGYAKSVIRKNMKA